MKIIRDWVKARKANQWSQNNNTGNWSNLCHTLQENLHCLFIHCFLLLSVLHFFLISVKMYLENKVVGFQFEPKRSVSNHEGFYQDCRDEGDALEQDMFIRKDCNPSIWCKCRNCSTIKTEKECLLSRSGGCSWL